MAASGRRRANCGSDRRSYTTGVQDGSKQEKGGAGAAIFKRSELAANVQQKLYNRCSNNQAEQLATLKVVETIESMNSKSITPRTVLIFTNSRVSLDSIHNYNSYAYLVIEIMKKLTSKMTTKKKIKFSWVKAHVGIFGNEITDRLAKEVARNDATTYEYSKTPISALNREAAKDALIKWQEQWTKTSKAEATKEYFPTVPDGIGTKIHLTAKLTAVLTGHGKTKAYLHRFNLKYDAKCICNEGDQTMDHILLHCTETRNQRE